MNEIDIADVKSDIIYNSSFAPRNFDVTWCGPTIVDLDQ